MAINSYESRPYLRLLRPDVSYAYFKTASKIKGSNEIGKVLEVIADLKVLREGYRFLWCNTTEKRELLGIEEADGEVHVFIRRLR